MHRDIRIYVYVYYASMRPAPQPASRRGIRHTPGLNRADGANETR